MDIDIEPPGCLEPQAELMMLLQDPMALHTTGLTEIIIQPCYMSPILFASYCRPASTPEDDKLKGQWVMVQPDLNAKTGLW